METASERQSRRMRDYRARPGIKERHRKYMEGYLARPNVKARRHDLAYVKRVCELDDDGVAEIVKEIMSGKRNSDIGHDWLIAATWVSAIGVIHGIHRKPGRKPQIQEVV